MEKEIWKDIVGYERLYQVSNLGRVKSLDRVSISNNNIKGKIISQYNKEGYKWVRLHKDGRIKHYAVHRLVAISFLPNPNNYPEVAHKDETRNNNCVSNLQWTTHKENCQMPKFKNRISNSTKKLWIEGYFSQRDFSGETNPNCSKIICEGKIFNSIKECWLFYTSIGETSVTYNTFAHWVAGRNIPTSFKNKGLTYYEEDKR